MQNAPFQKNSDVTPNEQRAGIPRGRLKNGNPSGDYPKAPRCGARDRQGQPCQCPAMRGKRRCRLHGGKSTGARTKDGIHRIRCANWKDGSRSVRLQREARAEAKRQEQQLTADFLRDRDDVDAIVRKMLGWPPSPRIKVRIEARAKEPPAAWAQQPTSTAELDAPVLRTVTHEIDGLVAVHRKLRNERASQPPAAPMKTVLKEIQQKYPNLDQLTRDQALGLREELRQAIKWKGAGYNDPLNQARIRILNNLTAAMERTPQP